MIECDGGCGVLVRPENPLCDNCLDIHRLLEARRARDARNLRYGVGDYARTDVGTVDHRRGDPCGLDDTRITMRERIACLLVAFGVMVTAVWVGYLGYIGIRICMALMVKAANQ
jgi:hypothetical protein